MILTLNPAQVEAIAAALQTFMSPGQTTEIRALGVGTARARSMVSSDVSKLAEQAAQWDHEGAKGIYKGIYFVPNPVRPDLEGSRAAVRKADIIERRWLLIDVDPVREAGTSATDAERQFAWDVLCRCQGELEGRGLTDAVVGDSGNGWHLCYPILLPNDDESQALVKSVLQGLHRLCSTEQAHVDTSTHDAPRIWKLYGTCARKGLATAERFHRYARIIA